MRSHDASFENITGRVNPVALILIVLALSVLVFALIVLFDVDEYGNPNVPGHGSLASKQITALEDEGEVPETGEFTESGKPGKEAVPRSGTSKAAARLDEPITLEGFVIHENGTPAHGAKVLATLIMDDRDILRPETYRSFSTTSGAGGRFLFERVPGGAYALSATRDGLAGYASFFEARNRGYLQKWPTEFEIILKTSGSISGRVFGPEGKPVSGALVIPHNMSASFVKTDPSGRFEITSLGIGRYSIQARAEGYVQDRFPEVYTGTKDLDIRLSRGGKVRGTVTLDGEPVPDVEVLTKGQGSRGIHGLLNGPVTSKSGVDGGFLLGPLAEGKHILIVRDRLYSAPGKKEIEIFDGEFLDGVEIALKRNGSISGRVTSATSGEPLPDLEVSYSSWPYIGYRTLSKPEHTFTDDAGRFVFTSLPPGSFSIAVLGSAGYATLIRDNQEIGEGENKEGIDFELEPGIPLHLTLRGDSGEPISGAVIRLRRNDNPGGIRIFDPLPEACETNEGVYVIEGLGPGPYHLTVQRYGWVARQESFEIEPEAKSKTLELVLSPTILAQGRVLDPEGSGVEGALVKIRGQYKSLTDGDGSFKAYDVYPGKNNVALSAEGFLNFIKYTTIEKEQEPLEFTLQPEGRHHLSGKIKNDLNAPLTGVKIILTQKAEESSVAKTGFTDPDGAFRFDGLPEGTAKLEIDKKHGRVIGNYSTVPVGQSSLEIVIERFARLKGRVTDQMGKPVEQFSINAWSDHGQGVHSTSGSFTNGIFDVRDASAGQMRISAYSQNVGDGQIGPLAVKPGETLEGLEIVIQPQGTISGIVLDRTTREPITGAGIYVGRQLRRTRWDLQDEWKRAVTGEDGTFTVEGLHPGTTKVAALHPDYSAGMKEGISVIRGQVTSQVEILLSRGAEINGRICVDGAGVSGISLNISGPQGEYIRTESGDDGYYRHTGLVPGSYHVSASLDEGTSRRSTSGRVQLKEGESATLDLAFTGSASIAGMVTRLGKPAAGIYVYANPMQDGDVNNPLKNHVSGKTNTGEDGSYRLDGLPPGLYTVRAYHRMGETNLEAGREVVLDQGVAICNIELGEVTFGEVSGHIFMNGNPVKDAQVYLRMRYQYKRGKSDDNGFYQFKNAPSGATKVTATCNAEGNRTRFGLSREINVATNESIRANFHFITGSGILSGSLTCNGKPVSDTWVYIDPDAEHLEEPLSIQVYCLEGSYRAEGLPAGRYTVHIIQPRTLRETVDVENNKESRIDINYSQGDAVLTGSVGGSKDGMVRHIYLFEPGTCTFKVGNSVITPTYSQGLLAAIPISSGGIFRQENLSPGTYDVVALLSKEGIAVKIYMKRITLQDGETTEVKLNVGE